MSEHTPITGELRRECVRDVRRRLTATWGGDDNVVETTLVVDGEVFDGLCDAIDAVHAALEDENAGLRARVAELDKRDDSMHDGWVELPKDADGEYIHIGDVVEPNGANSLFGQASFEVRAMRCDEGGWEVYDRLGDRYAPSLLRHYHAPTVEDVLREMHAELDEVTALYVGEVIDSDERDHDEARIFAEYAQKLRLAGDAE